MPVEFIDTDISVTGLLNVGRTLGDNDLLVVRASGSLTSLDDRAIVMSGGASLRVEGMVFKLEGGSAAIRTQGAGGMTIDVMAGGSIFGARDNVVIELGAYTAINNAGSIVSDGGFGISAQTGMILNNTGQILAAYTAVDSVFIASAGAITNSGLIRGGTGPGSEFSNGDAIFMANTVTPIVNTGTIESVGFAGNAIFVDTDFGTAETVRIENHGTLRSVTSVAIEAGGNARDGMFITNTGLITGLTGAIEGSQVGDTIINSGTLTVTADGISGVRLGDGGDILRNRGVIETRVDMGAGADEFDGSLSDQGDYVLGGTGDDFLRGGAFDDSLYGGDDDDQTFGGAGDDELLDSGGFATIFGGAGDDVIGVFGSDAASMSGGVGDDRIDGSIAADTLIGNAGDDTLIGGGGDDVYGISGLGDVVTELSGNGTGDRVESGSISLNLNLYANVENATLTGLGAFRLTGTAGANVLVGNVAANVITGGAGADRILGGGGADVIAGGAGQDVMIGGAGADVFVLTSAAETGLGTTTRDRVFDFEVGVDDLRMTFMGSYIGGLGFTAVGQVKYNAVTGVLAGNTDADTSSEWTIQMDAGLVLTSGDFVF